jgi:D-beta-D-heptose 7-phosphate kinase/D-beta-D-heptose 1-phosphate adenosyltransferase
MFVLITGGFDPLHSGHLNAFNKCADIGKLVVAPNSDAWLIRKKGAFLLPLEERVNLIQNLSCTYDTIQDWDDSDGSACDAIKMFHSRFAGGHNVLALANGGDRDPTNYNSAEFELCQSLGILTIFGVGGGKTASSSTFTQQFYANKKK